MPDKKQPYEISWNQAKSDLQQTGKIFLQGKGRGYHWVIRTFVRGESLLHMRSLEEPECWNAKIITNNEIKDITISDFNTLLKEMRKTIRILRTSKRFWENYWEDRTMFVIENDNCFKIYPRTGEAGKVVENKTELVSYLRHLTQEGWRFQFL